MRVLLGRYFPHVLHGESGQSTEHSDRHHLPCPATIDLRLHHRVRQRDQQFFFERSCSFSYIVWYKKGYQEFQEPHGTSIIKVKGLAKVTTNASASYLWDTPEYQIPALVCPLICRCFYKHRSSSGKQCILHRHATNRDLRSNRRQLRECKR